MTIGIMRAKSEYAYQIKPDQPNVIWVRKNVHNKRWKVYDTFDSPETARDALLRLTDASTDAQGEQGA